jgi:hypothetical protein
MYVTCPDRRSNISKDVQDLIDQIKFDHKKQLIKGIHVGIGNKNIIQLLFYI